MRSNNDFVDGRRIIAEPDEETGRNFYSESRQAFDSGLVKFLKNPEDIYNTSADIFCPCASRDILTRNNLGHLLNAGVRIIGGAGNNLFPEQATFLKPKS
jgi:glutamate dehydrogenase/leucine dehydrogenase